MLKQRIFRENVIILFLVNVVRAYLGVMCLDELFGAIFEDIGKVSSGYLEIKKNLLSLISLYNIKLYKVLLFCLTFLLSALETVEWSSERV